MITFGEVWLMILLVVSVIIGLSGVRAAYRNGVTDGYGYSREPNCPGYKLAGEYLKEYMAHRWPELLDEEDGPESEEKPGNG